MRASTCRYPLAPVSLMQHACDGRGRCKNNSSAGTQSQSRTFLFSPVMALESKNSAYSSEDAGPEKTFEFRKFISFEGKRVSAWHDIPLNGPSGGYHAVIEITRKVCCQTLTSHLCRLPLLFHSMEARSRLVVRAVLSFSSVSRLPQLNPSSVLIVPCSCADESEDGDSADGGK